VVFVSCSALPQRIFIDPRTKWRLKLTTPEKAWLEVLYCRQLRVNLDGLHLLLEGHNPLGGDVVAKELGLPKGELALLPVDGQAI
jgi:hypothetical protein